MVSGSGGPAQASGGSGAVGDGATQHPCPAHLAQHPWPELPVREEAWGQGEPGQPARKVGGTARDCAGSSSPPAPL